MTRSLRLCEGRGEDVVPPAEDEDDLFDWFLSVNEPEGGGALGWTGRVCLRMAGEGFAGWRIFLDLD